jgi:hypothetical protein
MFTPRIDLLLKRVVPLALAGVLVLAMTVASTGVDAGDPHGVRAPDTYSSKVTNGKPAQPCSGVYGTAL